MGNSVNTITTVLRVISKDTKSLKDFRKTIKEIGEDGTIVTKVMEKINGRWRTVSKTIQKQTAPIKKQFAGWALSIMFFGQAISRITDSIWKSSTKTFNDVMHSVEGTVTQFDLMQGSLKYLGFVSGQALEPLAALMIPIIDKVSDWILNNQELFASIFKWSSILGKVFAAGGAIYLAIEGFETLFNKVESINGGFSRLNSKNWLSLGSKIQKGIGIISIGFAIKEAKDAIENLKSGKALSASIDALQSGLLAAGGSMMLKGSKAGGYLVAAGVALKLVETGSLFTTLTNVFGWVFSLVATLGEQIYYEFKNGFTSAISDAISYIASTTTGGKILSILGISPFDISKKKKSDFNFSEALLRNQASMLNVAKQYDKIISDSISAADRLSEANMRINSLFSRNQQLFSSGELANSIGMLSNKSLFELLELDFSNDAALSDRQQSAILNELNSRGITYNIENVNVTANDLSTILDEINNNIGA